MRFGIIGCGTIAQVMHIPYVVEMPDSELRALVDPAADRVEALVNPTFAEARDDVSLIADLFRKYCGAETFGGY